jgi:hypothetical protein
MSESELEVNPHVAAKPRYVLRRQSRMQLLKIIKQQTASVVMQGSWPCHVVHNY